MLHRRRIQLHQIDIHSLLPLRGSEAHVPRDHAVEIELLPVRNRRQDLVELWRSGSQIVVPVVSDKEAASRILKARMVGRIAVMLTAPR